MTINDFVVASTDKEKGLRFKASIQNYGLNIPGTQIRSTGERNSSNNKIYRQLDERDQPCGQEYISAVYPIIERRVRIEDSFMIGLPKNLDVMNNMQVNIDIQLVDWIPEQAKTFGFKKSFKWESMIEQSQKFHTIDRYRKIVHLGSYNELDTALL